MLGSLTGQSYPKPMVPHVKKAIFKPEVQHGEKSRTFSDYG